MHTPLRGWEQAPGLCGRATLLRLNHIRVAGDAIAFADLVLDLVNRAIGLEQAVERTAQWLREHSENVS